MLSIACFNSCLTFSTGLAAIARATNSSKLRILEVNNCNIGHQGATELAEALAHGSSLTSLSIRDNDIGDEGVEILGKALLENKTLEELNLGKNQVGAPGCMIYTLPHFYVQVFSIHRLCSAGAWSVTWFSALTAISNCSRQIYWKSIYLRITWLEPCPLFLTDAILHDPGWCTLSIMRRSKRSICAHHASKLWNWYEGAHCQEA